MGERNRAGGALIVGHGTREERGRDDFFRLVRAVTPQLPTTRVEACFLELAEPTIEQGIDRLARQGVGQVTVAPLMLFAAGHVRRDVPQAVTAAAARFPKLGIGHAGHLGCRPPMLALSRKRYQEALARRPNVPSEDTVLLLIGRGAWHEEAIAEMNRFAHLRRSDTPVRQVQTAFLAMARPRPADALTEIVRSRPRRVVVQPHLLFEGRLMHRVRQEVDDFARRHEDIDWVVPGPLGPDRLLAEAVVDALGRKDIEELPGLSGKAHAAAGAGVQPKEPISRAP